MRADFTTSFKDSLRGEPQKNGEGRGGEDSSLPSHSLPFPLPFLSLPLSFRRPPRRLQKGNFVRFRIWGKEDII